MSELQEASGITFDSEGTEASESEQQAETQAKPENSGADLATDSPKEGEQNTEDGADIWAGFTEEQKTTAQQMAQKGVNKQHFKYREEQRKNAELQERLTALEVKQAPTDTGDVTIPPIPDSWDDDYQEKIRQRDDAIRVNERNAERKQIASDQQTIDQQNQQRAQLERSEKLSDQFTENATKLNVDQESLQVAQKTVIDYGITPELATALLEDSDGPLMVQHLALNPLVLHDLINATPLNAGRMLADVKVNAVALKPKTSNAPDPATSVDGRGAPIKERGPNGATFE